VPAGDCGCRLVRAPGHALAADDDDAAGMKRKKATPPVRTPDELIALAQQHVERGECADAEARYREALAIAPDHLGALSLLGVLLVESEDAKDAIDLLERARDLAPEFAPAQLALGSAYAAAGEDELAVAVMETAAKLDTTSTIALMRLVKHHGAARRPREAIGVLRRILRRDAGHAEARFILAALTGDRPKDADDIQRTAPFVEPPPTELIVDLFNTYAARFDKHLLLKLQYCVPKSLAALVVEIGAVPDGTWLVLDLGCGTGLAGVEFRAFASTLIGSDLSPRMIARARQRAIYDELHVEDLGVTLARARDVNLIVAADVFIYLGALEATIAACATALRPGGLLVFSVERSGGDDVVLQPTLRYAHADAYVLGLASTHALAVERAEPSILRVDNGQPVHGVLYALRR
jgi:predicted TPR repeat methyltransferase